MDKHKEKIYAPRFVGDRFKGPALPFEFLDDLQALGKINNEIARWLYLQKNPDRKRVPKNFYKGIAYAITGIENGSAMPQVEMTTPKVGLFPAQYHEYFQKAPHKLTEAIQRFDDGGNPTDVIPADILLLMERFGSSLQEDESVEFTPNGKKKALYTPQSRKTLLVSLSKDKGYTLDQFLLGHVVELDKAKCSFELDLGNRKIPGNFEKELYSDFLEAFNEEEEGKRKPVQIHARIRFTESDRPKAIEEVYDLNILEQLDVQWQLEGLAHLKEGWFEGQGVAYDRAQLKRLDKLMGQHFTLEHPTYIYPMPHGGVSIEWENETFDISLEVDLQTLEGEYLAYNKTTKESDEEHFALATPKAWQKLLADLNKRLG